MKGPSHSNPLRLIQDRLREHGYTAVITAATRLQGARRPMPPEAEYAKPPDTDDPLYNDSHYFNFFDHERQIGGFTRIGKLANQNASIGLFFIYEATGRVHLLAQSEVIPRNFADIRSGPIGFQIAEPLRTWRIAVQGKFLRLENPRVLLDPVSLVRTVKDEDFEDVEVDLTFAGWGEVHNTRNFFARGLAQRMVEKRFGLKDLIETRKFAAEHYEQAGSYTGTIRIGEKRIPLTHATGHRDHSWGRRDISAVEGWTWLTVQFGKGAAVNVASFRAGRLDIQSGFMSRNGCNYPCRILRLDTAFEDDGLTQKSVHFVAEDSAGFRMEVEGRVLNPVPIIASDDPTHRTIAFEAMTEYHWEGKTALGISEVVHKIDKRPGNRTLTPILHKSPATA
jgi:hypothetical protein